MPSAPPVELVIFDCDGVLVDSEPIAARVMAEALSEIGYRVTTADCIDRYTGISMAAVTAMIEDDWGRPLPGDFVDSVRQRDFEAFAADLEPVAGVESMLDRLNMAKCVASSGAPEKTRFTLTITGLIRRFEPHLFSAHEIAHGKPAPDLFLYAARKMGVEPESCAVIEDSVAGIRAGRAAGMRVLGFTGGGHAGSRMKAPLLDAGADAVFDRMEKLALLLGLAVTP